MSRINHLTASDLERAKEVTVDQLIRWIQRERTIVQERLQQYQQLNRDTTVIAALDNQQENLKYFEEDIDKLAKGIIVEDFS
jgi:DNA-binding protein H-NS